MLHRTKYPPWSKRKSTELSTCDIPETLHDGQKNLHTGQEPHHTPNQSIIVPQFFGNTFWKKQIPWTPSFLNLSKEVSHPCNNGRATCLKCFEKWTHPCQRVTEIQQMVNMFFGLILLLCRHVEKPANWLHLPCLHCWNQWPGQGCERQKLVHIQDVWELNWPLQGQGGWPKPCLEGKNECGSSISNIRRSLRRQLHLPPWESFTKSNLLMITWIFSAGVWHHMSISHRVIITYEISGIGSQKMPNSHLGNSILLRNAHLENKLLWISNSVSFHQLCPTNALKEPCFPGMQHAKI